MIEWRNRILEALSKQEFFELANMNIRSLTKKMFIKKLSEYLEKKLPK
jgi:hypothetical protein